MSGGEYASQTFDEQNGTNAYDARQLGPFQQSMDLTIQGKVFNAFSVNARLSNSRYGNYYNQRFGFDYKSKGTSLAIGDVSASLGGNELVNLTRTLQGLLFSRDFGGGKLRMSGMASMTKSVPRRGSFQGNGTSGPYYLNASNIIEGSEHIRLDGQDLNAGTDYKIDYILGQITFLSGRIINTVDTVEYSYETQNYNTTPGLLTGMRWDVAPGKGEAFGVTYITQKATSGSGGNKQVTDRWPVVSDLTYKYYLSSVLDTTSTVQVRYQNSLLTEGQDYTLNRDLGYIILLRGFAPDTALTGIDSLSATYLPKHSDSVNGDRSVMGLDGKLPVGRAGTVAFQFGQSQGQVGSQNGTGMTVSTTFHSTGSQRKNAWSLTTGWRDIAPGFTNIDSVSAAFQRAEKGLQTSFTFAPNDYVHFTTGFTDSKLATSYTSTTTTTTGTSSTGTTPLSWTDNRNLSADISLTFPNLPTLHLTHSGVDQITPGDSASRSHYGSDQISLAWQKGIWGLTGAIGRTTSHGQTVFGNYTSSVATVGTGQYSGYGYTTGTGLSSSDSTADTSRLQVSLTPSGWLSMSGSLGFSRNHYGASSSTGAAGSGSSTSARDSGLTVNLTPRSNLSFTATLNDSDNGQSTSSFYSTTGTTTTGTTGSVTPTSTITGQRSRSTALTFQYAPFDRLSFNGNWTRSLSLVPGYDNTQSRNMDLGFSFAALTKLQISGQFGDQSVTYVGGQGDSSSRTYSLTGTAGPFGRMSLTASLQRMNYGSAIYSSATGTGTGLIDGSLGSTSGTTGLFQQGINTIFSLRSDYAIGGNRSLFMQWQSLNSAAPTTAYVNTTSTTDTLGTHTSQNYVRGVGTIGLDIRLTQILDWTLDANIIKMSDHDNGQYSYRAQTFNMDLSARF